QRSGLADAVVGPVRVCMRNDGRAIGLAGVDLQRQAVAAAEDVVLADAGRQDHLVGRAVAHAQVDHARGLFLYVDVDVDLVGRTGHRLGRYVDLVEVAQAVDAVARHLDVGGVVPRRLHLPHFAPDDLVACAGVAADLDAVHVHAPARIDIKGKVGLVRVAVESRVGIDVGKVVAQAAQVVGDGLGRFVGFGGRKGCALFHLDELADFFVVAQQFAGQLDAAQGIRLAFVDGEGNEDVFAVGRD